MYREGEGEGEKGVRKRGERRREGERGRVINDRDFCICASGSVWFCNGLARYHNIVIRPSEPSKLSQISGQFNFFACHRKWAEFNAY